MCEQPVNIELIRPPPLPAAPVLSYEIAALPPPVWLARLICGLAIANGAVSVGYVLASRVPNSTGPHAWSDELVALAGGVLIVFGLLAMFRVNGSRLGLAISAIAMMLCNWFGLWVNLHLYGPPDNSNIGYTLVGLVDNATIPAFLVICLFRPPIKGWFSAR